MLKAIKEFPGYSINEEGQVWSDRRCIFLKPIESPKGFFRVGLVRDKKQLMACVNQLHAAAFGLPVPESPRVNTRDHRGLTQYTKAGVLVRSYASIQDVAVFDFNPYSARKAASGKRLQHKGFLWTFSDEPLKPLNAYHVFRPVLRSGNGEVDKVYSSIKELDNAGFSYDCIRHVLAGRHKTHLNYVWSYHVEG